MSDLENLLGSAGGHIDYCDNANIPLDVHDLLTAIVEEVTKLKASTETPSSDDGAMSRADALKLAREHVEAMSTNARGYQDGVKLSDKVEAMDVFARFLMGENA